MYIIPMAIPDLRPPCACCRLSDHVVCPGWKTPAHTLILVLPLVLCSPPFLSALRIRRAVICAYKMANG